MLDTLLIILEQACTYIPLIAGAYICIASMKVPDLSIESAYMFGAMVSAKMITMMHAPVIIVVPLVILASMMGGMYVGLLSSVITTYGKIPHLLSSILTIGLLHGITQAISGSYISLSTFENPLIIAKSFDHHPELVCLAIIACMVLIGIYLLFKTQLGYSYIVYGNNPHFFKYYHISSSYIFITGIVISNALAGLAGYLNAQTNGFSDLNLGLGKALLCITSLILGKTMVADKRLPTLITAGGTMLYFALQQSLIKIGFDLKYFAMVQAIIVLIILLFVYKKKHESIHHLGV
jgi:putative ABC transport system permease protein